MGYTCTIFADANHKGTQIGEDIKDTQEEDQTQCYLQNPVFCVRLGIRGPTNQVTGRMTRGAIRQYSYMNAFALVLAAEKQQTAI